MEMDKQVVPVVLLLLATGNVGEECSESPAGSP